ncbi:MAG: hypothetical protein J7L07_04885 [Candidatus Odinarchaeota archaeon]|nr:hypothetical protein [Candidatus Odinarchaeota archaeon]
MIYEVLLIPIVAFITTFMILPFIMKYMKKIGHVGRDEHKPDKPEIPESGGVAIVLGIIIASITAILLYPDLWKYFSALSMSVLIAGIIGIIDDFKVLGPKIKPIIVTLAGLPIILLGAYIPYLRLPFIGNARLFIVYPLIILIAMSLGTNTVNMLDVYNGAMPGTTLIVIITLLIISILRNSDIGVILSLILLGSIGAYLYYNKYPAKAFAGDVGSLSVGAGLVSIAIMARLEFILVVAMLPFILNSYEIIFSIGGLKERRQIKERPTIVLDNGTIMASSSKSAPITLARLVLAKGPLKENEIVKCFIILTILSCILAIISELLIVGGFM